MSARLLRRVLEQQEEHQSRFADVEPDPDDDDDEAAESPNPRSAFQNPFDVLEDQEVVVDVSEETSAGKMVKEEPSGVRSSSDSVASRKQKKKKKKSKETLTSVKGKGGEAEKSLDEILKNLSIQSNDQKSTGKDKLVTNTMIQADHRQSLLAVEPKYLSAENELRRIFGSKVVSSFENSSNSRSRRTNVGRRGGLNHRKTNLVSPSGYWPRWDGSLSMEFLETKDGQNYFRYAHSASYMQAQRAFDAAKAIHDVNGIASILTYHPYHVESLLTIAEILKFSGEHQSAADYIAKCLYALECAWHPVFTPFHAKCRLLYSHDTNKPFFSALFTHMLNMDRRGCHRCALEICKLLISIDSDDPMGALFCVDYFALRAEEYAWLERFAEEYRTDNSIWLFPNFSYSLAVSRFYLEKDGLVDAEKATSADLMKQALMLHPLALKKLVEKTPLKEAVWTKILNHVFFGSAKAGSPSLEHLIRIYVERSYLLWRLPELQKLLKESAHLVIDSINVNSREARDWDCVRKEAFSSERNEYSHLLISDFSDSVPTVPPEEVRNMMVDPRIAEAMHDPRIAEAIRNGGEVLMPEEEEGHLPDLRNRNPLMLLLEGLVVPLANMREGGDANGAYDHVNGNDTRAGGDANEANGHVEEDRENSGSNGNADQ
ncbi:hypothetical protein H6P81_013194 [Aristolochia fimbriata]|uniref:Transcription factor 25 n=1 Tax=Aristolochia fimbriata TaxID=158543 RepID=A0AAV7EF73_ARIFI|nr:hypothetical protein H6P81_013194 [Aristolochia fimbriata]